MLILEYIFKFYQNQWWYNEPHFHLSISWNLVQRTQVQEGHLSKEGSTKVVKRVTIQEVATKTF